MQARMFKKVTSTVVIGKHDDQYSAVDRVKWQSLVLTRRPAECEFWPAKDPKQS